MNIHHGIVEDRNDPLQVGRVRVRVHGLHTDDKQLISTPDLPWSTVVLPTTSAGLSGIGTQHGLIEGSTVVGFFRDDKIQQDFVVLGSIAGVPAEGYHETITDELLKRSPDKGFNDPRRLTKADYENTPDGVSPKQAPNRNFGIDKGMDEYPKKPESLTVNADGTGSTITEQTLTAAKLPFYPLWTDATDTSKYATGDEPYDRRDTTATNGIKSKAKPIYPFNKVLETESGHILELDDTPGVERVAIEHRSGTFQEIHPDGSMVTRVVNDNYTVICKDDSIWIGGKVNVVIGGDATVSVGGNLKADITGNATMDVAGTTDITGSKAITVVAPLIDLNATEIKLNS